MSPKPLNVGFVGTGIFASDFHLPALQKSPQKFQPFASFNRTKAKAEAFSKKASIDESKTYDSIEEIVADPEVDFIDALLPVQYNYQTIKTAVDAGKPIIIEKPLAATLADAAKIVKLDKSTDVPILIAEQWVYMKAIPLIKERLPKIGAVVSFNYKQTEQWDLNNPFLQTTWRQKPEHVGGYLSDGGVHQIALLTEVLGKGSTISAHTTQIRETSGDEDVLVSSVKMESGVIGTYTHSTVLGNHKQEGSFVIYGTKGSIYLDFSDRKNMTIETYIGDTEKSAPEKIEYFEDIFSECIEHEFANLHEAIVKKDKSILKATPEKTFHHIAFIAAAVDSAKAGGNAVKISQP